MANDICKNNGTFNGDDDFTPKIHRLSAIDEDIDIEIESEQEENKFDAIL